MSARRGHGDDSIYFDEAKQRYIGAVSLGWSADGKQRIRRKVSGRTKTEVRDKLRELRRELDNGLHTDAHYTVRQAVDGWLAYGLADRSPKTISTRREVLTPLADLIGAVKLREPEQPTLPEFDWTRPGHSAMIAACCILRWS